jgi:protein-S-isoprenylcysteine O-methyltransferase Ste14
MVEFLKIFLPIYATIFFFAVFLLRTAIVWQKTGINAFVLLKQGGTYGVIGVYFKLLPLASFLAVVSYSFFPSMYDFLAPFHWLENQLIVFVGIFFLIISLFWIWVAQTQMGNSWRIGIDEQRKMELITTGMFSISRNPIFLGMKVNLLGFFLVIPNAVTLTVVVTGFALIDIQVRLEEQHLLNLNDDSYQNYYKKVRRWL